MGFELIKYKFEIGQHRDKNVIWVLFPNDATLRNELKQHFLSVYFSGFKNSDTFVILKKFF